MNMLTPITPDDLIMNDDEPRLLDLRIAERLGFKEPRAIRKLIERSIQELETYGTLAGRRGASISGKGRVMDTTEYHLNEQQTLLVCMFSRTPQAAAVRREVIDVYLAAKRGELPPQRGQTAGRSITLICDLSRLLAWPAAQGSSPAAADPAPYLPLEAGLPRAVAIDPFEEPDQLTRLLIAEGLWKRAPAWWLRQDVRRFVLTTHRSASVVRVRAMMEQCFSGEYIPCASSLHRVWLALDVNQRSILTMCQR